MLIWNSSHARIGFFAAALLAPSFVSPLGAQVTALDPASSVKVDLQPDSPVALVSMSMGDSRASARGGATVLDLHMSLTLRNSGLRRVRGVTLLITTQEFAPGGKASVARPCIDVAPSQEFTVPVDVRLVRPVQQVAGGPLVRVQLDGVLFDDLSFFGPNKLNSQRAMTFWETEAQRDRAYFKQVLRASGERGLQSEILLSLAKQSEHGQLDVALSRNGRSVGSVVSSASQHVAQFAFLKMPDAPVQPVQGWAEISGNEARSPEIEVLNKSSKPVRYVEIGWMVRDTQGHDYLAGSVPASSTAMLLPPGQKSKLLPDTTLKFSKTGRPVEIQGMTGFVKQVEFADGKVWVPSREELKSSPLLRIMAPSPEEQRLADIYANKGIAALIAELNRY
ncbi:MAG: hypothetical protein KGN84_00525 [Acidobacteriota bacterium]|nr:hypothetical protein [Acidobacteriota bacterium]